jgi:hypothetical protein
MTRNPLDLTGAASDDRGAIGISAPSASTRLCERGQWLARALAAQEFSLIRAGGHPVASRAAPEARSMPESVSDATPLRKSFAGQVLGLTRQGPPSIRGTCVRVAFCIAFEAIRGVMLLPSCSRPGPTPRAPSWSSTRLPVSAPSRQQSVIGQPSRHQKRDREWTGVSLACPSPAIAPVRVSARPAHRRRGPRPA